jgi:hypothetical protein
MPADCLLKSPLAHSPVEAPRFAAASRGKSRTPSARTPFPWATGPIFIQSCAAPRRTDARPPQQIRAPSNGANAVQGKASLERRRNKPTRFYGVDCRWGDASPKFNSANDSPHVVLLQRQGCGWTTSPRPVAARGQSSEVTSGDAFWLERLGSRPKNLARPPPRSDDPNARSPPKVCNPKRQA